MTQFIRVRSAEGPAHEYDVSVDEAAANASAYVVIDGTPVDVPRAAEYFLPSEDAAPEAAAADAAPEPSVGDIQEEGA